MVASDVCVCVCVCVCVLCVCMHIIYVMRVLYVCVRMCLCCVLCMSMCLVAEASQSQKDKGSDCFVTDKNLRGHNVLHLSTTVLLCVWLRINRSPCLVRSNEPL